MNEQEARSVLGASGAAYQIEVDILWLANPGGDLLVTGGIDDGSIRRAFAPLTQSFVVSPDGRTR
jgi:hypothetical protein